MSAAQRPTLFPALSVREEHWPGRGCWGRPCMPGGGKTNRQGGLDVRFFTVRGARLAAAAFVLAALVVPSQAGPASAVDPCGPPVVNPVACENTRPGTPSSSWDISGSGSTSIQGFATQMSVNAGETESFKVKTTASSYRLDVYRMGYYGGN